MMQRHAIALALIVAVGLAPATAQSNNSQAVRLAVADYIGQHSKTVPYLRNRPLMLIAAALPVRFDKQLLTDTRTNPVRTPADVREIAAKLGGTVGSENDNIACSPTACTGTNGALLEMGEPTVTGDSANVVYSLRFASTSPNEAHVTMNRYVAWLRRLPIGWTLTAVSGANHNLVGSPHPIRD